MSINEFDIFETKRCIDSPRSLEACMMEGILPHEILHVPMEEMAQTGLRPEIVKMRYEFNEKKRIELINLIKQAR